MVKCPTIKNRRGGPNGQETPMSIAESVIGIADKVLGKFIPDKTLRDQLRHEMNMAFHEANLAQVEVNKQEAASQSMFVAGWRPFVLVGYVQSQWAITLLCNPFWCSF